jgi:hypothetical protein
VEVFLILLSLYLPSMAGAHGSGREPFEADALLAEVGHEAVLLSDLERFSEVTKVLDCAGVVKAKTLAPGRKALLDAYIEEELMFLDAKAKKLATDGMVTESKSRIFAKHACRTSWQKLGENYNAYWRTEARNSEGGGLLARELEKQVLVEKYRRSKTITDPDLWNREIRAHFPVKVFMD